MNNPAQRAAKSIHDFVYGDPDHYADVEMIQEWIEEEYAETAKRGMWLQEKHEESVKVLSAAKKLRDACEAMSEEIMRAATDPDYDSDCVASTQGVEELLEEAKKAGI